MSTVNLNRNDKVVVVMGPTGSGKSTFINYATQGDQSIIGHSMKSYTNDIRIVREEGLLSGGRPVVFVDTPGLDDTTKSNIEVLSTIAGFLVNACKDGIRIDTLLYLHRISDNRMEGSHLRELQVFRSMCDGITMPNVVLVTTMWSLVNEDIGNERLRELEGNFWKPLTDKRCKVMRFYDSTESAHEIALSSGAVESDGNRQAGIATELLDNNKKLKDTTAGAYLEKHRQTLERDQKEARRKLKEAAKRGRDKPTPRLIIGSVIGTRFERRIQRSFTRRPKSMVSQPSSVTTRIGHIKQIPTGQGQIQVELRLEIDLSFVIEGDC